MTAERFERGLADLRQLITDAHGTPLAVTLTGGHRNDAASWFRCSTPSRRSAAWSASYVAPLIARRGVEHSSGPGTIRWPVERTFA